MSFNQESDEQMMNLDQEADEQMMNFDQEADNRENSMYIIFIIIVK